MPIPIVSRLRRLFVPPSIAIDLGTANTRIFADGKLIEHRTLVRHGHGPATTDQTTFAGDPLVRFPKRRGVVVDVAAAAELLAPLVEGARGRSLRMPRAIACVPATASDDQRQALVEAIHAAGVGGVAIAPEPLAAAIGAGVDLSSPWARLVVDIGDGITELAVIRSGSIDRSATLPVACSDLRSALRNMLRSAHGILVHEAEADSLLRLIATGVGRSQLIVPRSGRNSDQEIRVPAEGLLDAVREAAEPILEFVGSNLRNLPDRIAAEVIEGGLCLTGGGAALPLLVEMIRKRTLLDVRCPADPLHSTIRGARQMLATAATTQTIWH